MGYHVEIDQYSGFCSGVIRAIRCAEDALTGKKKYTPWSHCAQQRRITQVG